MCEWLTGNSSGLSIGGLRGCAGRDVVQNVGGEPLLNHISGVSAESASSNAPDGEVRAEMGGIRRIGRKLPPAPVGWMFTG